VGYFRANCYIFADEYTGEAVVIDPGDEVFRIMENIEELGVKVRYILLTHGHFDHTDGAEELGRAVNAPVYIHRLDSHMLRFQPDGFLSDGDIFNLSSYSIKVIHTPGHTAGSVCFFTDSIIFTGDTLFAGSVGRTFSRRDHILLVQSIMKKIIPLGDHIKVYPGHGPSSTIGKERISNPFLQF